VTVERKKKKEKEEKRFKKEEQERREKKKMTINDIFEDCVYMTTPSLFSSICT